LNGAGNYIVFRAYPGERPVLEDPTITNGTQLNVQGSYLAFWGLEVRDANTNRTSDRTNTVFTQGDHNKFINLIIHDGNVGILTEPPGTNTEISGCIIYNNGWDEAGNRGHGHGIYIKNTMPSTALARDNIIFNQFGYGIHAYTDKSGEHVDNVTLRRNVAFNNGTIASKITSGSSNIMVGADTPGIGGSGDVLDSNMTYWSYNPSGSFAEGINVEIGRDPNNTDKHGAANPGTVQVTNNYFVGQGTGGRFLLDVTHWASGSIYTNNQFLDCAIDVSTMAKVCGGASDHVVANRDNNRTGITWSGNTHTHLNDGSSSWLLNTVAIPFTTWNSNVPASDALVSAAPSATQVFMWKTAYETGRGNIIVYNWGNASWVDIDLSGIVPIGKEFKIWNVYDLVNPVVLAVTFSGGEVSVPLWVATTPPQPKGWLPPKPQPQLTGTAFNAYIVRIAPY
jgi:hypothetical protein